mgnify:FL=1
MTKSWYVVYTRSRAEKKAYAELLALDIEAYLPTQRKLRQWSDRKKWVDMPLFPGYIFVHITNKDYDKTLKINNIVSFVRFEGKAAIVSNSQIESIKQIANQTIHEVDISHQLFNEGDQVQVTSGPLIGLKGSLISYRGKKRVAVIINQLSISLLVEINVDSLEKIKE